MSTYQDREFDSLNELFLDPLNPRLRKDEENADQATLIEIMLRRFKIEEVAESILAAGWLDQDPLIAVQEDGETRVVEGNRRLTAVKLLLNPSLASSPRLQRWSTLASELDAQAKASIERLRVRVYPSRDDPEVSSYIGFRHVTGVLPWPAMEKASYIARLAGRGASYRELAEKLGSYPSHMIRHHVAFQMVEQAEQWGLAGAREMGDAFGVLLRALQTEGVRAFLDLKSSEEPTGNTRPIAEERRENFTEFILWTFGAKDRARVLPESRELTKWSKILQSPAALSYLRNAQDPNFNRAWARSGGESESVANALWRAAYLLADVVPLIDRHGKDPAVIDARDELERHMRQINTLIATESDR